MEESELKKIIKLFESNGLEEKAHFGIFQTDVREPFSYIKANKHGLELFISSLLKALVEHDKDFNDNNEIHVPLDIIDRELYGDIVIDGIKIQQHKNENKRVEPIPESLNDKIARFGCIATLLFILASFVIGITTIFSWLLSLLP